jgi:hypothetical protein
VEASLTWLDLTSADRDKMRQVLDLLEEQGTVDEMGLGSLRDALADELFPGTSTIQTRLRYFFFVPWIYQQLEHDRVPSHQVAKDARAAELALIEPLRRQDDHDGLIGARARGALTRLPSSVYWAGLVHWGIFQPQRSQGWYHSNLAMVARRRDDHGRADDPGVVWEHEPTWHTRLPAPPSGFPESVSFELTRAEATFVLGRLEERCQKSLLTWLARDGSGEPARSFWEDATALGANETILNTLELARRFSLHVEGAPLLYNLMLAERRRSNKSDEEWIARYREELAEWAGRESVEPPFIPPELWTFVAKRGSRSPSPQRQFVEAWAGRVREIGARQVADDDGLRRLIEARERALKGQRARLANKARLLSWSGRVGVGRMDFRWFRVRQLLKDLWKGRGA